MTRKPARATPLASVAAGSGSARPTPGWSTLTSTRPFSDVRSNCRPSGETPWMIALVAWPSGSGGEDQGGRA